MEYTIMITGSRMNRLKDELKDQIIKIEQSSSTTPDINEVTIRINDDFDVLRLFHAGIECGADVWRSEII